MRRYQPVRVPPERVWELLRDPFNLPAWGDGVIEVRALSTGELRMGYRFAPVIACGPLAVRLEQEVNALWPGQLIGFTGRGPGFGYVVTVRLMETPEGTGVDCVIDWNGRTWWARAMAPMLEGQLGKRVAKSLRGLVGEVEKQKA